MIRLSLHPTSAQAQAIITAGAGAAVQHVRAGNRKGRGQVIRKLGALGVPSSITKTLGWSTADADAEVSTSSDSGTADLDERSSDSQPAEPREE